MPFRRLSLDLSIHVPSAVAIVLGLICGLIFVGSDFRVGPVRIRWFDIGLLWAAGLCLHRLLTMGLRADLGAMLMAFLSYVLYAVCNAAVQSSSETAFKEAIQFGLFLVFFLMFVHYVNTEQRTRQFLFCFLSVLWILALVNAYHHLSKGDISGWKELGDQKITHSVIFIVMTVMTIASNKTKGRVWWSGLLLLALIFLFLSGERKGWAGVMPALLVVVMLSDRGGLRWRALRQILATVLAGLAVVGLLLAISPYIPYLSKQVTSTVDFVILLFTSDGQSVEETTRSNNGRLFAIELGLRQFAEHPVFGIGLENYSKLVKGLAIDEGLQRGAHNELVRIAAELGSVGLLSYAVVNIVIAARLIELAMSIGRLEPDGRVRLRLGIALFVFGFLINIFLAGGGLNVYFYMLPAALAFSIPRPRKQTKPTSDVDYAPPSRI